MTKQLWPLPPTPIAPKDMKGRPVFTKVYKQQVKVFQEALSLLVSKLETPTPEPT